MHEDNKIYRRLFESANAAIIIIDIDFKIIDCNEMASKMFDRPKDEILNKTPDDITISPLYQDNNQLSSELGRQYFSLAMEGNDLQFEWTHLKKDGTSFLVEVSLFGFEASDRKNFFGMWRDLSEVKKKDLELKESEERFRTIFSQAIDGLTLHKIGAGCFDCNEAAVQMLGYSSKEEFLGKTLLDISPEFQHNEMRSSDLSDKYYSDCNENGYSRFEWIHLKKNGEKIFVDVSLTKISYKDEIIIHAFWRDITEKKKREAELKKYQTNLEEMVEHRTKELKEALRNLKETQSQLIQSEKMASLGVLTSGVAHELNNPLNFIQSATFGLEEMLQRGYNEDILEKTIKIIKTGVSRSSAIIKGLDQFSSKTEGIEQLCNLHDIIDNCILIFNSQLKNRITIDKQYTSHYFKIKGNVSKLHQLFINTISNANDAIKNRGVISIQTVLVGNWVEIEITDNGIGIPNAILEKVMDPFFTTKEPGKGTGLGLSISYSIIKEHNGKIHITSELDKGTKVKITLPLS